MRGWFPRRRDSTSCSYIVSVVQVDAVVTFRTTICVECERHIKPSGSDKSIVQYREAFAASRVALENCVFKVQDPGVGDSSSQFLFERNARLDEDNDVSSSNDTARCKKQRWHG